MLFLVREILLRISFKTQCNHNYIIIIIVKMSIKNIQHPTKENSAGSQRLSVDPDLSVSPNQFPDLAYRIWIWRFSVKMFRYIVDGYPIYFLWADFTLLCFTIA